MRTKLVGCGTQRGAARWRLPGEAAIYAERTRAEDAGGKPGGTTMRMTWWAYALLSAVAAAATAILAKIGVKDVPSNLATAIRTVVILVFAWGLVFAAQDHHALRDLNRRSVLFLVLSGVATGISWLAYFKALKMAPASRIPHPALRLSIS